MSEISIGTQQADQPTETSRTNPSLKARRTRIATAEDTILASSAWRPVIQRATTVKRREHSRRGESSRLNRELRARRGLTEPENGREDMCGARTWKQMPRKQRQASRRLLLPTNSLLPPAWPQEVEAVAPLEEAAEEASQASAPAWEEAGAAAQESSFSSLSLPPADELGATCPPAS